MAGKTVKIGNRLVGNDQPCYVVAEIGINHNGSLDTAKELIKVSSDAGCDAVKFQKRTVEVVYTPEELTRPRENPFGPTNGDLKRGLEFGLEEYQEIDQYCKELNIDWFVSCWDEASVDFIEKFNPPCYKIASASLTDDDLLRHHRKYERPIILSTGMSTMEEIEHAIEVLGEDDLVVLHSTSTYPAQLNELNLRVILTLKKKYNVPIGYSGHEPGLSTTFATAVMGASIIEKHITLDRALWGSDQAASVEPHGVKKLVEYITQWEEASGNGIKKVYDSEIPIREKLRRKG
jgi:N-acetylneuraminate synthase